MDVHESEKEILVVADYCIFAFVGNVNFCGRKQRYFSAVYLHDILRILGISAFYHDSAAALIEDGEIIAAAQEERFSRVKHDTRFPKSAVDYCLKDGKPVDYVAFYDKPLLKFERLLETYLSEAPKGFLSFRQAMPVWIKEKLFLKQILAKKTKNKNILFAEHHQSHAASAFFPSPFDEAAILTIDGVGEWATTSLAYGKSNSMEFLEEIHFPHSLGLLYSAFTYYTGFKVNSGEYKVMGLAPYGKPTYVSLILNHLIDIKDDGSFRLNMDYFNYSVGSTMTNKKFDHLFGGPPRKKESKITQREMDLARSIQDVTEEVMVKLARHIQKLTGSKNLCLAGGVALNCVGNGKILQENSFENIWIQPAAGDAGGAIGAALAAYYQEVGNQRAPKEGMKGSFLGPKNSNDEVKKALDGFKANVVPFDEEVIADCIAQGKVVGWHQGRMEFGPRALGARSILGDPRDPGMQKKMNLKIKFRESFRPFAPAVLREKVSDYFDLNCDSPYMLLVAQAKGGLPATTHIDGSARIQTVHQETNPKFYSLIKTFEQKTGCAVLINTSFNVRGEPIVCTPEDSYRCFMRTEMDVLVIENVMMFKENQPAFQDRGDWKTTFELD